MKTIKELIAENYNLMGGMQPFWILDAEILDDGTLWFAYTFNSKLAKENCNAALPKDVYDELVESSIEMYKEAAHYIVLRAKEIKETRDEQH